MPSTAPIMRVRSAALFRTAASACTTPTSPISIAVSASARGWWLPGNLGIPYLPAPAAAFAPAVASRIAALEQRRRYVGGVAGRYRGVDPSAVFIDGNP